MSPNEILPDIRENLLVIPTKSILAKSEFIYPLPPASQGEFDLLWQEIRRSQVRLS